METLSMFPLEYFEKEPSRNSEIEIPVGAEDDTARNRIGDTEQAEEERESEVGDAPDHPMQHPGGSDSDTADEHVAVERTHSIYQATGLVGPFELGPLATVFPYGPEEDLRSLADSIRANGLVEEITVAMTRETGGQPLVIDGKRRLKASEMAGVQVKFRLLGEDLDPRAYIWARNGERNHLNRSQLALAFCELFPKLPPGRPPKLRENCRISDSFARPTQGQGAKIQGASRDLINKAYKVVDPHSQLVPEVREAIRSGTLTISDAVKDNVSNASPEVQREALSLVNDGGSNTISSAVEKVKKERLALTDEPLPKFDPPLRIANGAAFYRCSVDGLILRLEPNSVDFILACPPMEARIGLFSEIGALAGHALSETGVMAVAVPPAGSLAEMLGRLARDGMGFIAEFSLLFPAPITDLGDPHYTRLRRAALLLFGKHGARMPKGDDVLEVPAPDSGIAADDFMNIEDGLPQVVKRFAIRGQTVCIPILKDNRSALVAALESGCTVIGADADQAVIEDLATEISQPERDSSTVDNDAG